ncbi:MAG: hypothetical protein V7678_01540 [Brevundimonas sp.]
MSARILSAFLSCALVAAVALSGLALAFALIGPLAGQPLDTGFAVACETSAASSCAQVIGGDGARLVLDHGSLALSAPSLEATVLRAVDTILTGGFWIALIALLRRFTLHVSGGRPFAVEAPRQLTWAGGLMLVFPLWELARSALWQAIVLSRQPDSGPLVHTLAAAHPSGAVRLLPEVSPGLALAGLVLLVIARAFAIGVEVQRDSDEVV